MMQYDGRSVSQHHPVSVISYSIISWKDKLSLQQDGKDADNVTAAVDAENSLLYSHCVPTAVVPTAAGVPTAVSVPTAAGVPTADGVLKVYLINTVI